VLFNEPEYQLANEVVILLLQLHHSELY
jgi:hypothetical protein